MPSLDRAGVMTSATMSTFGTMTNALQALGYNRADRTYLTFAVNSTFCGIGSVQPDSSPARRVGGTAATRTTSSVTRMHQEM